jgi:hypothetical protein
MLENKFERNIQEKMGELRFEPSAPVWTAVEAQIRQKRRKRRVFIWFFFAVLLLGGGTWLLLNNQLNKGRNDSTGPSEYGNRARTITAIHSTKNKPSEAGSNAGASESNVRDEKDEAAETNPENTIASQDADPAQQSTLEARTSGPADAGTALVKTAVVTNKKIFTKAGHSIKTIPEITKAKTAYMSSGNKDFQKHITDIVFKQEKPVKIDPMKTAVDPNTERSIANRQPLAGSVPSFTNQAEDSIHKVSSAIAATDSSKNSAATTQPAAPRSRPRIEWSVQAFGGQSHVSQSSSSGPQADILMLRSYPAPDTKPDYEGGFAGGIEVAAALPLNPSFSLTGSLGYAYYRAKATAGGSAAGNAQSFISGSMPFTWKSTATYDWHIVALGAGLRWKPASRLPLYISTGLQLGQQVGGHSWSFQESNSSFAASAPGKRTQLSWQSSIEYRIWHKGSRALLIGPRYDQGLGYTGPDGNLRLSAFVLQARFRF